MSGNAVMPSSFAFVGREYIAVYIVRFRGDATMPSISDVYGKVWDSFLHWSFPRSVRRGSRMVWLAMLRLWKPWAWRMKVIVGGMAAME